MKKIILIAAVVATSSANAFWDDQNSNGDFNGAYDGKGDAAGEATFSMDFSGKGNTNMASNGDFKGNADNNDSGYYSNSDFFENGNADMDGSFDGKGDAAGEATFSMNFSGKGNTNMATKANTVANADSSSTPYYGYAPQAPVAAPAK